MLYIKFHGGPLKMCDCCNLENNVHVINLDVFAKGYIITYYPIKEIRLLTSVDDMNMKWIQLD